MAPAPAPAPKPDDVQQPAVQQYDDIVRLKGRAVVYRDGQRLGETGYDLMIVPPQHRRLTLEPGKPPTDRPDITGFLTDRLFLGEDVQGAGPLTLMLEDGRRLEFRISEPETNEIIGVGDLRR